MAGLSFAAVHQRSPEASFAARDDARETDGLLLADGMGVERNKLTAGGVATIKTPGRHSDGGNLYLNVAPTGGKSWVFMYRFGGRQREMGLGSAADTPLVEARNHASSLRRELKAGRDPLAGRTREKAKTFGDRADAYVEAMRPQWKSAKHADQGAMTLTEHAASLRGKPVQEVDTHAVLEVLQPIWLKIPETASRLRGRIENVLDAAKA